MGSLVARTISMYMLALLVSAQYIQAKFVVEHGSLKVTNPDDLKGNYDIALANFGVPMYGAELRGVFVYPQNYALACNSAMHPHGFPDGYRMDRVPGYSTIALIDRGECRFTEKVQNAELVGADAVLICDDKQEPLITMDASSDDETQGYVNNITIPAALVEHNLCQRFKAKLYSSITIVAVIDWSDALPHPDDRVEWEFWSDSNNGCGPKCDAITKFLGDFTDNAMSLEKKGYTKFTPHYLTYHCLNEYIGTRACQAQCISNGKYCATDPDDDIERGYEGKDVVLENLRQLCVFQEANKTGHPWLWWDYVSRFSTSCKMSATRFNKDCAEPIIAQIGLDLGAVQACMGNVDDAHPLLEAEKMAQVGSGERGDVTINPTIIINEKQYRGKMDQTSLLMALCAGFDISQEPEICVNPAVSERDCEVGKQGFLDCSSRASTDGRTTCQETFRGYECVCKPGASAYMDADGNEKCGDINLCLAMELKECTCDRCVCINQSPDPQCYEMPEGCKDNTCWKDHGVSACVDQIDSMKLAGLQGISPKTIRPYVCKCPEGYEGEDPTNHCENINECKFKCRGSDMKCEDTEGSFKCDCANGKYDAELDTCIEGPVSKDSGISAVAVTFIVLGVAVAFAIGGYALYTYRLRSYMDAEIRQIMSQYMPLDKEAGDDMAGGHMGMQMGGSHEDNFSSSHDAPDTTNNFHPPTLHASEDTINQL
mmetsp:Transcript_41280/g.78906  ORF Transcript_41280/g.78906 Transcript_41280/m.78906 type:complete len:713 (+) Transcript_41280:285-2423(+)